MKRLKRSNVLRARPPRATANTSYPADQSEASPYLEDLICEDCPEVPYDDPAWDDDGHWEDGPWIPDGAVLVPPQLAPGDGFTRIGLKRRGKPC